MSNRELKFRVVREHTKEIIGYERMGKYQWESFYISPENKACNNPLKEDYQTGTLCTRFWQFVGLKRFQFSGVRDENGKEIYDGDILNWSNPKNGKPVLINIKHGQIFFNNSPAVWAMGCVFGTDSYNEYGLPEVLDGLEVIGNIYQNPELLTQKKQ